MAGEKRLWSNPVDYRWCEKIVRGDERAQVLAEAAVVVLFIHAPVLHGGRDFGPDRSSDLGHELAFSTALVDDDVVKLGSLFLICL